jgi:hypothetical protein
MKEAKGSKKWFPQISQKVNVNADNMIAYSLLIAKYLDNSNHSFIVSNFYLFS